MVEMQRGCIYIFMARSQQCCITQPSPEIAVGEGEECRGARQANVRVFVCACVCVVCVVCVQERRVMKAVWYLVSFAQALLADAQVGTLYYFFFLRLQTKF